MIAADVVCGVKARYGIALYQVFITIISAYRFIPRITVVGLGGSDDYDLHLLVLCVRVVCPPLDADFANAAFTEVDASSRLLTLPGDRLNRGGYTQKQQ